MNETIDYSLAKQKVANHLQDTKTDYSHVTGEAYARRMQSIDDVLSNDELLSRMTDIQITSDIISLLKTFERLEDSRKQESQKPEGLLPSLTENGILMYPNGEVNYNGESKTFNNPEEFREFLYSQVGFTYQKPEDAMLAHQSRQEVLDPIALSVAEKSQTAKFGDSMYSLTPTIYRTLDNLETIDTLAVPKHDNARTY